MTERYRKGSWVEWDWGQGSARAKVVDSADERIERTINGNAHSRNGTAENPAYLLEQDDGQTVLKLHSELRKADS